jgi:tetratricopeptide (TPR) repeat protein
LHAGGLLLALAMMSPPDGTAVEHLAAGARAFREARYGEALVEFRVAQNLGAADAAPYAAATLVKLGRPEEALEAFAATEEGRDTLLDYYRGIACYEAKLYLCAGRLFTLVAARSGPRIAEEAARARGAIASELAKEPSQPAIDWYLARCGERRDAGRPALAAAYCQEAVGLAERRADRYRLAEATTQLAGLPAGGRGAVTR